MLQIWTTWFPETEPELLHENAFIFNFQYFLFSASLTVPWEVLFSRYFSMFLGPARVNWKWKINNKIYLKLKKFSQSGFFFFTHKFWLLCIYQNYGTLTFLNRDTLSLPCKGSYSIFNKRGRHLLSAQECQIHLPHKMTFSSWASTFTKGIISFYSSTHLLTWRGDSDYNFQNQPLWNWWIHLLQALEGFLMLRV